MNISQKKLTELSLARPNLSDLSTHPQPKMIFPFNETSKKNNKEIIISKILAVNFYESTRVQNRHIESLAEHIALVMDECNLEFLQTPKLSDEYFILVEKIASGHGLKTKDTNESEDHLISFSSKFCAHHNQVAPFYDRYVFEILKYWVKDFDIKIEWHNYRNYVDAFLVLQQHQHLESFSLRHIESYTWQLAKNLINV